MYHYCSLAVPDTSRHEIISTALFSFQTGFNISIWVIELNFMIMILMQILETFLSLFEEFFVILQKKIVWTSFGYFSQNKCKNAFDGNEIGQRVKEFHIMARSVTLPSDAIFLQWYCMLNRARICGFCPSLNPYYHLINEK